MNKVTMKDCLNVKLLAGAILAGIMIAIGGNIFLCSTDRVVGSFLFCFGLFTVCVFKLELFTGKCGYLVDESPKHLYLLKIAIIWVGNFIGSLILGYGVYFTKPAVVEKVSEIWASKLTQTPMETLFFSICCGLIMYIVVDNFRNSQSELSKYLGIFIGIPVFILSGFEHSIADMFYMNAAGAFDIGFILLVTLGNMIGSFILPLYKKLK